MADTGADMDQQAAAPEAQEAAQSAPAFDMDALNSRFDQYESKLDEFRSALYEPDDEQDSEPESSPFEGYEETGDPAVDAQRAQQAIQDLVDQQLQKQLGPIQEQQRALQTELEIGDLEAQYPALQQQEVAEATMARAQQVAAQAGNPELARNAAILKLAYLANEAEKRAASEAQVSGVPTGLEAGAGATPGPTEADLQSQIRNAGGVKNSLWGV